MGNIKNKEESPSRLFNRAMKKRQFLAIIDFVFIRSWWLALFLVCGYFSYQRAMNHLACESDRLQQRARHLKSRIQQEKEQHTILLYYLTNWDQPQTLERILIQRMGLTPKGYHKVYLRNTRTDLHP